LAELRRTEESIPREIEKKRLGLEAARAELERMEAEIEALNKESRAKERRIEEVREGQRKSKGRLMEVKTNEEYSALLKEIEFADQQISLLEDEVLVILEKAEEAQAELAELREKFEADKERFEQEKSLKLGELERVRERLKEEEARRAELAGRLPGELMTAYERIRRNKGGLAVVAVREGVCQGCNQRIPPQTYIDIKRDEILYFCQGCSRILYHPDEGSER
jgi:hypothetical protein